MVSPGMVLCKADQCSKGSVDWPIILYTSLHMALAANPVNYWREESLSAAQALLYTFGPYVKPEGCAVTVPPYPQTQNNTY